MLSPCDERRFASRASVVCLAGMLRCMVIFNFDSFRIVRPVAVSVVSSPEDAKFLAPSAPYAKRRRMPLPLRDKTAFVAGEKPPRCVIQLEYLHDRIDDSSLL